MDTKSDSISSQIRSKAAELGFDACGMAPVCEVDVEMRTHFTTWLSKGRQGKMQYMENHMEKRLDPKLLVPGAKSVICLAMN